MYERSAIVLERYFNKLLGYDMPNNLKTNFYDYNDLVQALEKYKNISEEEETIMQEYDSIANKIRSTQKIQESLFKKNNKLQEERNELFQNIDEDVAKSRKRLDILNNNISTIDEEIKKNAQNFIDIVEEFNEKSTVRENCGRTRRSVENEYNKKLNATLDDFQNISIDKAKDVKQFKDIDTADIEKELKEKLTKNGEKEKIPFSTEVINKAIDLCIDIQKREAEVLSVVYDKTNKLFMEIKNNATKVEKHKKLIRDAESKINFLNAFKEYLVQFLDNERLTAVNNKEDHDNLMTEACKNLEQDLEQINNLYTILIKEATKKVTKKTYNELYNLEYLADLEAKAEEFDKKIKKLNLSVTIINPNNWRIEGMKKIYDVFNKSVTEIYDRDLSVYQIEPKIEVEFEEDDEPIEEDVKIETKKKTTKKTTRSKTKKEESSEEDDVDKEEEPKKQTKKASRENKQREEIDKKIDMILCFVTFEEDEDDSIEDENDFEEDEEDDWNDDIIDDEDDWEDDIENDIDDDVEEDDDDEDNEYEDDEYEDDDYEFDIEDEEEDVDNEDDDDAWESAGIKEEEDATKNEDDWENEFVKVDNKKKTKKKKSFFDKFKK